jgi:hypothetical protein
MKMIAFWVDRPDDAVNTSETSVNFYETIQLKDKAFPLRATEALVERGGITPAHSRPRN